MSDFTGYVLAGGKSSRMGTDKAFLKIGEKTFLENAVEILKPVCAKTKVVINKLQTDFIKKLPGGVSHISDSFKERGALGGVHAALADCQTKFAVVLAIDLPFVTSGAIRKLCEIILIEESFSAIVPRQPDGKLQPLCAIYRVKDCLPKAGEILSKTGSASMRDFIETVDAKIIGADCLNQTSDLWRNINSPADYQNIKNQRH